jgi:hypothetical protein
MADTPIDERKFTDREVREILKKAVERAPSRALVKSEGLSLAELKAIGEEVGIDPARLEDAARAVTGGGAGRANRILGAPTVFNFERKVEREFDPDDTHEILSLIRRTMGQQGEVSEVHGAVEWSAKGELGERYVTLSPRDGTTAIHSSSNLSNAAILTYLPTGIIGFFVSIAGLARFAKSGSEIGLLLFLTVLPILYPILRTIFSRISGSEAAKLQRVVDELARLTEGSGDGGR